MIPFHKKTYLPPRFSFDGKQENSEKEFLLNDALMLSKCLQ